MDEEDIISRNSQNSPLDSFAVIRDRDISSISLTQEEKDFNIQLTDIIHNLIPYRANYTTRNKSILPINFDPQNNVWKERLVEPTNQGNCGSCWSFAASGCLTDRFNILCGDKYISHCLSPVNQIFCNNFLELLMQKQKQKQMNESDKLYTRQILNTCQGNSLVLAFTYLKTVGVTYEKCMPYTYNIYNNKLFSTNFGIQQSLDEYGLFRGGSPEASNLYDYGKREQSISCDIIHRYSDQRPYSYCLDTYKLSNKYFGTPQQNFFSLLNYSIYRGDEDPDNICYDIYKWGPVATSFIVYDDFYTFDPERDGVYIYKPSPSNQIRGGHAVEIVGWGVYKDDVPFWWIKNSWGKKYGENGYFRFLRGKNQCQIEYNVISLIPNLFVDFSNATEVEMLGDWIFEKSNIFESGEKNKDITSGLLYDILKTEYVFLVEDAFQELWNTYFKKFPRFGSEIIRQQSGFLQYLNNTRCGYTLESYYSFPYLDYSCPQFHLPMEPDYFAGSCLSNITKPWDRYWILNVLSCLGVILLVLVLLWTRIDTRNRIR